MLTNKELGKLFPMFVPIADNGLHWDGKPQQYSNLPKWGLQVSQLFGADRGGYYSKYGLAGHNGLDIAGHFRTPIVAPCKMWVNQVNATDRGYGLFIKSETETRTLNGDTYKIEMVFGHFDEIVVGAAKWYEEGSLLGYMDSTGDSTGDHLHFGTRPWFRQKDGSFIEVFLNNGLAGWSDPEDYITTHLVWDWSEVVPKNNKKFMEDFKNKNDKKLIINNTTGEWGWFYNDKLRIPDATRKADAIASYLIKKEGVNIDENTWNDLPKVQF